MSEMNEGVKIILARMETNPEDFFTVHKEYNPWRWIFDDSVREVMTEPEKAALFEGIKKVRRLMITHKALEAVMPKDEGEIGHIPPPPWGIAKQGASNIALTPQEQRMKMEHIAEQRMKMEQIEQMKREQVRIMKDQQNALLQSQPNPYQNAYQNVGSGGTTTISNTLSVGGEVLDSLKKLKNLVK